MKTLNFEQMESVNAGKDGCCWSALMFGLTLVGTFASYVTLNPLGIALGTVGIIGGFTDMVLQCGHPSIQ